MLLRKLSKSHSITRINTTKITKKNKDKVKDLSYIKCYIYKQKNHYTKIHLKS